MCHTADTDKLLEILRYELGAVVRDDPWFGIGEFLPSSLKYNFDVCFGHRFANLPVNNITAETVQYAAHVIKCAANVNVRNINVLVLMRFQSISMH